MDTAVHKLAFARRFLRFSPLKNRVRFVPGRLENANFPDNSFDRAFSFCVLEHIPNLDLVLREVFRVLKPGGELHVSVDSLGTIKDPALLERHKREHGVHQYFTPASIQEQLEAVGFEGVRVEPILTGDFAASEFYSRIEEGYRHGPLRRRERVQRFWEEDRAGGEAGIMLIARAHRPHVVARQEEQGNSEGHHRRPFHLDHTSRA